MYLVRYPVVVWPRFALLTIARGAIAKDAVCFRVLVLSFGDGVALRRIPAMARML